MRFVAVERFIGSNWYRRPRKRPLVGPTGSPFLDILVMQTRSCRWFRKNKSVNPLKRVTFRKYDRVTPVFLIAFIRMHSWNSWIPDCHCYILMRFDHSTKLSEPYLSHYILQLLYIIIIFLFYRRWSNYIDVGGWWSDRHFNRGSRSF